MVKDLLTPTQLKEHRQGMYPEYKKLLKTYKHSKMDLYAELAEKYLYKNAMVVFHTIRRIEGKNKPKPQV